MFKSITQAFSAFMAFVSDLHVLFCKDGSSEYEHSIARRAVYFN